MVRRLTLLAVVAVFVVPNLFAYVPSPREGCTYGVVDVTTVSGIDPDGTVWVYSTYYMGWICPDGYLIGEQLCCSGGGSEPTPTPTPTPQPTGCSLSACLHDCDVAYLEEGMFEVSGNTVLHQYKVPECGCFFCSALCMEANRMNYDLCRGNCSEMCNQL